ncbi:MAG: PAS domain S-box protein [Pseudomonadota bacterium]
MDVKQRAQAERETLDPAPLARDASEDRLWDLIDETGDGAYETDNHGNFTAFSNSFCNVLGYPREEIQDQNFAKFMDRKDARKLNEVINKVWVNHQGFSNLIWEIRDKDGNRRIIEISAYLVKNNEGKKMGFRGIARDVTEEYQTRDAFKEAKLRYEREFDEGRRAKKRAQNLLDFVPYPMVVFSLAGRVTYVNPAFTEVFGWTLDELIGRNIPYVPPGLKEQTREDLKRLLRDRDGTIETKRMTKDGHILDVIIRGQISSEGEDGGFGEVFILRDITEERRMERTNETLFQISKVLPQYPGLEELLDFISEEVKRLLNTEGAIVGLFDEEKNDFYFLGAAYDDSSAQRQIKKIRYPVEKSVSGRVVRTGKPAIVTDTSKEPDYYDGLDKAIGFHTHNLLIVPLMARERTIGVLAAINRKTGTFDQKDERLLTMIASTVALSIENARFSKELKEAYQEVSSLNRAKDKIINHLSHELKTPVSILLASLSQMSRMLEAHPKENWQRAFERARRNLDRILEIQYQVEDIMRDPEYKAYPMLSFLLDQCIEELEALVLEKTGQGDIAQWIRERIEGEFGPKEGQIDAICLGDFVKKRIEALGPRFSHRRIKIGEHLERTPSICMPSHVVQKVVDGLIKNAVENTPDNGMVDIFVHEREGGVELVVKDLGRGITPEDQKRIFEGFFVTQETMFYSSRHPFDFDAGGKGADLLRMKVFSERYGFQLNMESTRCRFLTQKGDLCPGDIGKCKYCQEENDCYSSGGTIFTVLFSLAPEGGCQPKKVGDPSGSGPDHQNGWYLFDRRSGVQDSYQGRSG